MVEGLLLGRFLLPILAVGRARGLDNAAIARLGLVPERLATLDTMVPSGQVYRLLEEIAGGIDIEELALDVATATTAADMGPLGFALRSAPTGRLALDLLVRFQRAVNTVARFHLLDADGEITLAEDRVGPDGLGRLIAAEITAMTNIHFGRRLFGDDFRPIRVAVPRRGRFRRYAAFAGCPVAGGAPRAAVTFAAALVHASRPEGDEEMFRFLSELLAERAGPPDAGSAVAALRRELAAALWDGEPTVAEMARRLGWAARSLQRRLAGEGRSFSQVLDELRHELSLAYLARPKFAIPEVAFALGFHEVASFHRAFRRWEGTTPAAYRSARAGGAVTD
jgi:AraC-like DNA-binding protein